MSVSLYPRRSGLPAGGDPQYYVEDFLGSSRVVTNPTGVVCYDADFTPFGGDRPCTDTCPAKNSYKFEGKERDTETGNDDFGARFNSSNFGRFMSPDPLGGHLGDPQTFNKYSYVSNSPINLTDPTELYTCKDDPKDGPSHCASDDRRFEAARQNDLRSTNPDVVNAAKAYDGPNDVNGVTLGFADLGKVGEGGITESRLGTDANGNLQAQSDVTINSSSKDTALDADVGHEGSHVEDAQKMVASITFDKGDPKGNYKVGDIISQYSSEQLAFAIRDAIYRSATEPYHGCPGDQCALGAGSSPIGIPRRIDQILLEIPSCITPPTGGR